MDPLMPRAGGLLGGESSYSSYLRQPDQYADHHGYSPRTVHRYDS